MDSVPEASPIASPQHSALSSSCIDEELAYACSKSLAVGNATVKEPWYAFALPKQLHPGLYNSTLKDTTMESTGVAGFPDFPDFPDFWQGESSYNAKKSTKKKSEERDDILLKRAVQRAKSNRKSARAKRNQRRLIRKPVNVSYGSSHSVGKELKKRLRDQRRMRRKEKVAQLQKKNRQKKNMRDICKGMASIKCK